MLILFKKIRKYAIDSGRLTRYAAYAVGEIILVVIGILIALKINDWDHANQEAAFEIQVLEEIQANLNTDLIEIRDDISLMQQAESHSLSVLEFIKHEAKPNDTFNYSAARLRLIPHFDETRSGYDLLESKGIGLIKNSTIRNNLSELYEKYYPYYSVYERERMDFHREHNMPVILTYFYLPLDYTTNEDWLGYKYHITQEDFDRLKTDPHFVKVVHAYIFENSSILKRAKRMEGMIIALIDKIQIELESLSAS